MRSLTSNARQTGRLTSVTVTSPNGGEYLRGGHEATITWTADAGAGAEVTLDYSTDGGTSWVDTPIAAVPAATGEYVWSVPGIDADDVLVRVTGSDSGQDMSDASFSISMRYTHRWQL